MTAAEALGHVEQAAHVEQAGHVREVELPVFADPRGQLAVAEDPGPLPFAPHRVFVVSGVPEGAVRAEHAHRTCDEALLAASGGVTVELDDGERVTTHRLDRPSQLLVVPRGTWVVCRDFTPDAALVVLASRPYDPSDVITDRARFPTGPRAGAAR